MISFKKSKINPLFILLVILIFQCGEMAFCVGISKKVAACLKAIDRAYGNITTYEAEVHVGVHIKSVPHEFSSSLKTFLIFEKPNNFRVIKQDKETTDIAMVSDGRTYVKYLPSQKEYIVQPAPGSLLSSEPWHAGVLGQNCGIAFIAASASPSTLLKENLVRASLKKDVSINGSPHWVLHLEKKVGDREVHIDAYVDKKSGFIGKMVFDNKSPLIGGEAGKNATFIVTDEHFNVKVNEPLRKDVFQFKPPANVRKVDEFTFEMLKSQKAKKSEDENQSALVGKPAPAFSLVDLNGREHELSSYKGKAVVMDFWAVFCPPCRKELPILDKLAEKYESRGLVFITINGSEPKGKISDFLKANSLERMTVLLDPDGKVSRSYDVRFIPQLVIVDKNGIVANVIIGLTEEEQLDKEFQNLLGK